jgi:hypothetical protein
MVLRFSITEKFVFAFLVLSMIPLCLLGITTLHSLRILGQRAIDSSSAQLEQRARESLELRAIELANRVSQFLNSCEADLVMVGTNAAVQWEPVEGRRTGPWMTRHCCDMRQSCRRLIFIKKDGDVWINLQSG